MVFRLDKTELDGIDGTSFTRADWQTPFYVCVTEQTRVSQLVDFQGANDEHHLNERRGKTNNWPWPEGLA